MTTIFISYRRDDAAAYAGRLYDGLRARYGEDHVFMDVDRIQPGENFATVIESSIRSADVVLAVIGETWLTVTNESGRRRLDDPHDFVRLELKATLDTGRRLIPVLVGGAGMPAEQALPPALRQLAAVQAVNMSDERWDYDTERLTKSIDAGSKQVTRRKWLWWFSGSVLAAALMTWSWFMAMPQPAQKLSRSALLRAAPAVVSADQARAMVAQHNFFHKSWNAAATAPPLEFERQVLGADIVVKEARYQLMWQQRASPQPLNREGAQRYVQDLNARRFAGHGDWRLPTLEEAMGLMGSGATEDCHLHRLFDRSGPITRTADTTDSGNDWIVYFCDGIAVPEVPGFNAQVRAVRTLR
jgi:hypothetical protein